MGHIGLLPLPGIPAYLAVHRCSAIHHLALLPLEERVSEEMTAALPVEQEMREEHLQEEVGVLMAFAVVAADAQYSLFLS